MTPKQIADRLAQIEDIVKMGYADDWKERCYAVLEAIVNLRLDIERDLLKDGTL